MQDPLLYLQDAGKRFTETRKTFIDNLGRTLQNVMKANLLADKVLILELIADIQSSELAEADAKLAYVKDLVAELNSILAE